MALGEKTNQTDREKEEVIDQALETEAGREAGDVAWANPHLALYG